jgi:hypothetical protein
MPPVPPSGLARRSPRADRHRWRLPASPGSQQQVANVFAEETVRRYSQALYPMGALLICVPLGDLALRVSPPQFGTLQWRFASAGLLFGNLGTIVLGVSLVGFTAALLGHRKALRVLGFAALALGVVLLAMLVLFALDALQIRRLANANFKRAVLMSSIGAIFTATFAMLTLAAIGRAAVVASKLTRVVDARRSSAKAAPQPVVARPSAAALSAAGAPSPAAAAKSASESV